MSILTATPDVANGAVVLEVAADPADYPRQLLYRTAGDIYTEWQEDGPAWSFGGTVDDVTRHGDLVAIFTPLSTAISLELTGLVVGRRTVLTFAAQRTTTSTTYGIEFVDVATIPTGSGVWDHVLEFIPTATSHTFYVNMYANSNPLIRSISVVDYPTDYNPVLFALTRTDGNGVRSVRLMDGQEIVGGSLVVTDYEAALVGPITYHLTTPTGATANATTTLEGAASFLAPAVYPQFGISDLLVTGYEARRPSSTIIHEPIGSEYPVARLGVLRARRGRFTLWCASYAALVTALGVYRRREVILLRQPTQQGADLYHVATDASEGPYDEEFRRWRLDVDFVEVGWPRGPLRGAAGWTWDDVVATFATWDDVVAFFPTGNDLQIGPTQ